MTCIEMLTYTLIHNLRAICAIFPLLGFNVLQNFYQLVEHLLLTYFGGWSLFRGCFLFKMFHEVYDKEPQLTQTLI